MSTRKHWRGPPRWKRTPGPDPSTPIPHETIRKGYEYVEQRQLLLHRKQRAAHIQASEVDRIQQPHRDLHLAVEDPTEISARPTSPDESVFVDTGINLDLPAGTSQKPGVPKRSQILALIRTPVAQRTEGQ